MDRALAAMLERRPWSAVLLLAATAICLTRACTSLAAYPRLSDSTAVYAVCAAALSLLTGSVLRVQQQLESRGGQCYLHALVVEMVLVVGGSSDDAQRVQQVLRGNTAALRAAFGCGMLQQASELLAVSALPANEAAAAALARTAAKPAVLLPWMARLVPMVQQLRNADPAADSEGERLLHRQVLWLGLSKLWELFAGWVGRNSYSCCPFCNRRRA